MPPSSAAASQRDQAKRRARYGEAYPIDEDFLAALEQACRESAGIALGRRPPGHAGVRRRAHRGRAVGAGGLKLCAARDRPVERLDRRAGALRVVPHRGDDGEEIGAGRDQRRAILGRDAADGARTARS